MPEYNRSFSSHLNGIFGRPFSNSCASVHHQLQKECFYQVLALHGANRE